MRKLLTLAASAVALTIADGGLAAAQEKAAPARPLTPDSLGAGALKRGDAIEKDPAMERRRVMVPRPDAPGAADTAPNRSYNDDGKALQGARVAGGLSAQQVVGASVHNATGDEIGEVEDLVIGPKNQITVAIVEVGGFLGMGSKTVAVEIDELDPSPKGSGFITALTKAQLKTRPAYRKEGGSWVRGAD
jgi:hypothetical protein